MRGTHFMLLAVAACVFTFAVPRALAQGAPVTAATAQSATDEAVRRVRGSQQRVRALESQKKSLTAMYEKQLTALDRLKRRPASWRRNRKIRAQKATSLQTAKRLTVVQAQTRAAKAALSRARKHAVAAIEIELRLPLTAMRRAALVRTRQTFRAPAKYRKISLPDTTIDELADPEELELQVSRVKQAEARLHAQMMALTKRVQEYKRISSLRAKRLRVEALARLDDNSRRRFAPRQESRWVEGAGGPQGDSTGDPESLTPEFDPNGFEPQDDGGYNITTVDSIAVLAGIVDAAALGALRSARRGRNLGQRVKTTETVAAQVRKRLLDLRKQRKLIEKRVRTLRRQNRYFAPRATLLLMT